jgi:hypothetical protein
MECYIESSVPVVHLIFTSIAEWDMAVFSMYRYKLLTCHDHMKIFEIYEIFLDGERRREFKTVLKT